MSSFPKDKTEVEVIDKRIVKRITIKNFIANALDAFNITRGGIYTIKQLIINPGRLVNNYIGLERHRYMRPINLLIISTALVLIVMNYFDFFTEAFGDLFTIRADQEELDTRIRDEVFGVFASYFNLILWSYVPIAAFFSYLFNLKRGANYAENLVFQTYFMCVTNILILLFTPLLFLRLYELASWAILLGLTFYSIYPYKVFFKKKWFRSGVESLTIYFISSIFWMILLIAVLVLISYNVATDFK